MYYLGPMGNLDPIEFINLETQRLPFKNSRMQIADWTNSFRSWPNQVKGWRNWYCRISASKRVFWDERDIDQCITLSIADMERNESLLIATSHFWSVALNAFVFAHGLMSITLADVLMLTGLKITGPVTPFDLLDKTTHQLKTKDVGGWSDYISAHARTSSVDDREHTVFLNMWLKKISSMDQLLDQPATIKV